MKGRITEIKEGEHNEKGIYVTVWFPRPHGTFTEGETEEDVKKKIQEFKKIHPGDIEFDYMDDK